MNDLTERKVAASDADCDSKPPKAVDWFDKLIMGGIIVTTVALAVYIISICVGP